MHICGNCRGRGFVIFDWDVKIKSKNYGIGETGNEPGKKIYIILLCALVVLNLVLFLVFFPGWNLGWSSVVVFFFCDFIFCLAVGLLLFLFRFVDLEGAQWHACEHKVVNLIKSGKKVNLENLKRAKRVHWDCGTWIISMLFVGSLGTLILLKNGLLTWLWQEQYAPWYILPLAWGLIGLAYAPSLPLQYFFTTAEPTEAQLKESLEVVRKFVALKREPLASG